MCWLPNIGIDRSKLPIFIDRSQVVTEAKIEIPFGIGGTRYTDGFLGNRANSLRVQRHTALLLICFLYNICQYTSILSSFLAICRSKYTESDSPPVSFLVNERKIGASLRSMPRLSTPVRTHNAHHPAKKRA